MTWGTATGRPVIVCILQQEFDECAVWAQGCTSAMGIGFVKPTASESVRGPTQAATIHASIPPEKSPASESLPPDSRSFQLTVTITTIASRQSQPFIHVSPPKPRRKEFLRPYSLPTQPKQSPTASTLACAPSLTILQQRSDSHATAGIIWQIWDAWSFVSFSCLVC